MRPYPLTFEPILKEKVWGGRRLAELGKPLPPGVRIGESWEVADLPASVPGGRSIVAGGALAGRSLRDALLEQPRPILGAAKPAADGGFPLLVKYLDAAESLSVQVHPTPAYAARHPEAHLKSEAWVVLMADPGAVIYKGLRPEVTRETFARHLRSGEVVDDLMRFEVAPGDCHYLPSGTCHALGAGIVVAEIQTPSDTTFRVYDWGRGDRALHVERALECITFGEPPAGPQRPGVATEAGGVRAVPLLRSDEFALERLEAVRAARLPVVTSGLPEVWMVLAGAGRLEAAEQPPVELAPGTTVLVPAALEDAVAVLGASARLLRVTLPSPLEGLIA